MFLAHAWRAPRTRGFVLIGTLATVVVLVLPPIVARPPPYGILSHVVCQSTPVGSEILWTPVALLDSPYRGNASARAVVNSGPAGGTEWWSFSVQGGTAGGLFSLDNWSVIHRTDVVESGPGFSSYCPTGYWAVDQNRSLDIFGGIHDNSFAVAGRQISATNSTSDASNEQSFNLSVPLTPYSTPASHSSVQFNARFAAGNSQTVSFCGSQRSDWSEQVSSSENVVKVPFTFGNVSMLLTATLPASIQYSYLIPAGGTGSYEVQSGNPTSGAGLAFDWAPC